MQLKEISESLILRSNSPKREQRVPTVPAAASSFNVNLNKVFIRDDTGAGSLVRTVDPGVNIGGFASSSSGVSFDA